MAKKASSKNNEALTRLVQTLRFEPDDEDCERCLRQLDEYIRVQLAEEDYMVRYTDVAKHLDACLDCASAYARLYELELAEVGNRLPQPEKLPNPNLDFLTATNQTDLTTKLLDAFHSSTERLRFQFSANLLPLLRPAQASPLTREAIDSERYREILVELGPELVPDIDWPLSVTVYRDTYQPDTCLIEIGFEPAGLSWPDLGERVVTLRFDSNILEAVTDAWGVVTFSGVPIDVLANLNIEIS